MTHKDKVLALLRDGRPHTHHELYALGCIAHSRVADLRRDGYRIECRTETHHGERVSVYQLVSGSLNVAAAPPVPSSTAVTLSEAVGCAGYVNPGPRVDQEQNVESIRVGAADSSAASGPAEQLQLVAA